MSQPAVLPMPLIHRDVDQGPADQPETISEAAIEAEIAKAHESIRAKQELLGIKRAEILARERMVPGAAVIIEVAFPDKNVSANQIGRITALRGPCAVVKTKGAVHFVEVLCPLEHLHWIPS